jgi:hypothetical protein
MKKLTLTVVLITLLLAAVWSGKLLAEYRMQENKDRGEVRSEILWKVSHKAPISVESWGNKVETVANPVIEYENLSDSVIRWEKGASTWEGFKIVLDKTLDLSQPRSLAFQVFCPRATVFQIAIKSTEEFLESSRLRAVALPGFWTEVRFDLGAQLDDRYDVIYLFVDEENPVPGTFYFDNFRLVDDPLAGKVWKDAVRKSDATSQADVFVIADPNEEKSVAMIRDWPPIPGPVLVENPNEPGNLCWHWLRPEGSWMGFAFHLPEPADLRRYAYFEIDVISPRAGRFHLMANQKGEKYEWLRSDITYTPIEGDWTTVSIPIPDLYRQAGKFQIFHLFINWEDQPAEEFWLKRVRLVTEAVSKKAI